jgi:protein involved in sex pheromone biosynthesis
MSFFDNFRRAQSKNDFAIEITDEDWDSSWSSIISKQTNKIEIDFIKRTLKFYVRQMKSGVVLDIIFHIMDSDTQEIDLIKLTPAKGNDYEILFRDGVLIDHHTELCYEETGDMIHEITIQFKRMVLFSPKHQGMNRIVIDSEDDQKRAILMEYAER